MLARYARMYRKQKEQPIYEWARKQIRLDSTSPIQGNYDIENSPQFKAVFDAYARDDVRMVTTIGPNQGGRDHLGLPCKPIPRVVNVR